MTLTPQKKRDIHIKEILFADSISTKTIDILKENNNLNLFLNTGPMREAEHLDTDTCVHAVCRSCLWTAALQRYFLAAGLPDTGANLINNALSDPGQHHSKNVRTQPVCY